MKLFTVHIRHEAGVSMSGLADGTILVKEGFSWFAFLAPILWLLVKRMWIVFAIYAAFLAILVSISASGTVPPEVLSAVSLAANLVLGFEGSDLYRWSLARRRYRERGIVAGDDVTAAEHRLFAAMEHKLSISAAGSEAPA